MDLGNYIFTELWISDTQPVEVRAHTFAGHDGPKVSVSLRFGMNQATINGEPHAVFDLLTAAREAVAATLLPDAAAPAKFTGEWIANCEHDGDLYGNLVDGYTCVACHAVKNGATGEWEQGDGEPTAAQMEALNNPDSAPGDGGAAYRASMRDAGRGGLVG